MAMYFYYLMFIISLVIIVVYAFIFNKRFDANLTIMVVLIPVINLGFLFMGEAKAIEEALIALKLTYIGGCFVLITAMFLIFNICKIKLPPWLRTIIVTINILVFCTTLTIGHLDIFYKGIPDLAEAGGASYITNKSYGFMHTIFYIMVGLYYLVTVGVIVYSFFKKRQVPRTILLLVVLAVTIAVFGFFGSRLITHEIEILPATYNLGMIIYLIIATRLRLYNTSEAVMDSLIQKGETGFVSFDNKVRFLGSNDIAKNIFPELKDLVIDSKAESNEWVNKNIISWINEYKEDESKDKRLIEKDNKVYLFQLNRLIIWKFNLGYQFLITDDTANQEYIKLIKNYNDELQKEVEKKTRSVIEIQEKLVLGMATMIEGRDNSTGGHIKRTSDCVRILADEIKKNNIFNLTDEFINNIIKAAPMHDLGTITIDDEILRKPGKYTPEEFEIMKTHASEGARIVKQILDGTDDVNFMKIAVNVAHFHHERWDGSGYPNKLKGEEIPLEARIMAIADVYDALVSKRVYKEKMSFEEANKIIMDGMGKHFDKSLEPFYLAAKPKLEEYYLSLEK